MLREERVLVGTAFFRVGEGTRGAMLFGSNTIQPKSTHLDSCDAEKEEHCDEQKEGRREQRDGLKHKEGMDIGAWGMHWADS